MPTALSEDGRVFEKGRMAEHVEWLIERGIHGIGCVLRTGGFAYLSREERSAVIQTVVEAANGRVPILAGTTGDTTAEAVMFAKDAEAAGADVAMVQAKSFVKLEPGEIVRHFENVATAIDLPIGIYNHPPTTGVDITPELYATIVDSTGAVVTKDGSLDLFNVPEVLRTCGDRLGYLSAHEPVILGAFALGAAGCSLSMASVFPEELVSIYEASVEQGDIKAALKVYNRILPVIQEFQALGTPRATKAAATIRGCSLGPHRPPIAGISDAARNGLKEAIAEAGIRGA